MTLVGEAGIGKSRLDARCIGSAVLEHIRAWETHTYAARVEAGTWQPGPQAPQEEVEPQLVGGRLDDELSLRYANGTLVTDNPSERQAYLAYAAEEKRIPGDVEALRQWVRATPGGG